MCRMSLRVVCLDKCTSSNSIHLCSVPLSVCTDRGLADGHFHIQLLSDRYRWQHGFPGEISVDLSCTLLTVSVSRNASFFFKLIGKCVSCLQGQRCHHHQCRLQMRQNPSELLSVCRHARQVCWERFAHPRLPFQPVWQPGEQQLGFELNRALILESQLFSVVLLLCLRMCIL